MADKGLAQPELLNVISFIEKIFKGAPWTVFLKQWENIFFSSAIIIIIAVFAYIASREKGMVPGAFRNVAELFVETIDEFVCGVMGPKGVKYSPFIGTLFIYILGMNLFGLIPFMKSATSSWSTTLALALCVFIYLQYTVIKELGLIGYIDHLMGRPRGFMAITVVFPLLMLFLHVISELVKPITLSLRLRSNVWGDDLLIAIVSGFGVTGIPLLLVSMVLTIISSLVQAVVFALLTTIYFSLFLEDEEEAIKKEA